MHTLYCLSLGESYRQTLVSRMIDHINAGQGRESLFMLPSSQLLAQVRQEVLDTDPSCLTELNLLSFDDLVTQILAESGVKRTFMSRMTQELLVQKVVNELTQQGRLPYFCEMSHFPGYIRTITSLLGEIKRTGTTAEEWQSALAAKASEADELADLNGLEKLECAMQKDQETALIYLLYQEQLSALKLADLEELYLLAIDALRKNPDLLDYRYVYFSEFYIFTPLQLAIVNIMKQGRELAIAMVYEKNRPEVYSAVEETYAALIGQGFSAEPVPAVSRSSSCLDYLVGHVFTEKAMTKQVAPCISLVTAPHRRKELAVLGGALKEQFINGKMKPQDVAIIVRNVADYSELRPLFAELKIPLDLAWEEPLEQQPLVQLLADYIAARIKNGSKAAVQKLLRSPFVTAKYQFDGDRVVADSNSRRIENWIGWLDFCREDCLLLEIFTQLREQMESIPRQATAAVLNREILGILDSLDVLGYLGSKYRQNKIPLERLKASYLTYQALKHNGSELEKELAAIGQAEREITLQEYQQLFVQLLSARVLNIEAGDQCGVKVFSPATARGVSFKLVAILGLTEGEFPQQIRENWLYGDRERKLLNDLGVPLATAAKRRLEEKFYFAVSLSMARNGLYLSGLSTNETLLSPFFAEVERLVDILPEQRAAYTVDEIFASCYEAVYTERGYVHKAIYDMFQEPADSKSAQLGTVIFNRFEIPGFWRKVAAASSRREDNTSPFSGHVAQWQAVSSTSIAGDQGVVWSISRLEDYLKCPFAYFLKHILRISVEEEAAESTKASEIGQLYHQVLAAFLSRYRGQKLVPERAERYESELLQDFARIVEASVEAGRFYQGGFWFYEQQQIAKVLVNWLYYELERQTQMSVPLRPAYFEWGFGLPVTESMDRASVIAPFSLVIGDRQLLFCGKVDRIDATQHSYAVFDYKKSGSPSIKETLEVGTDLQIPLYIAAVQQLLADEQAGTVMGGAYYSLEKCTVQGGLWNEEYQNCLGPAKITKKSFLSEEDWAGFYQQFGQKIIVAIDAIASGDFPPLPVSSCPAYCIGQGICRKEEQP